MIEQPPNRRGFIASAAAASAALLSACATGSSSMAQRPRSGQAMMPLADPLVRQGQYVDVNGARIFVQASGQGTPMMLIHGYPLSGALFARVRDDLSRRFRVITIDLRGYGQSRAPGVPDSIATYAQDALAVMQRLNIDRAHIGGMSMGGPIVFEMYRQAPQLFSGMMLIDTIAAAAKPPEAGLWRGTAEVARTQGVAAIVPGLIKEMLTGETRLRQPQLVTYLETVVKQASVDAAVGGAMALATRPDYTQLLGSIRVPTLVMVGVEDSVYPVEIARMMSETIPSSRLALIPGAAHAAIFEEPRRATDAILGFHAR